MSIRNMDADLAANKLNELFHLHRYEDCVLFLNRLSHVTIRQVISQISIDMYLSRLPYTIEIFETLYAKTFIIDPENFPTRNLQPERLIDKMVAYFSLLSDMAGMEPIDGARLLDSFENVIRVISYVQPNLYSRLLYFKYAIDKGLLRFENDIALYNSQMKIQSLEQFKSGHNFSGMTTDQSNALSINQMTNQTCGTLSKRSSKLKANALTNALLISRASNMQTCESLREEIVKTVGNCEKALVRLNEFISQLKSQKIFKDVQFYMNQSHQHQQNNLKNDQEKENMKIDEQVNQESETKSDNEKTLTKKSGSTKRRSNSNLGKSAKARSESVNGRTTGDFRETRDVDQDDSLVSSSTICQDFIQNRLYLNKAMMNTVEKHLETIKLHQSLIELYEKIDLDKEILLVFTHLKQEEKYLSSSEPLQPLFRRYSLGFERCIQIWRRKCSADSLLLFNDRFNNQQAQPQQTNHNQQQAFDQLYICNQEDSNNIDQAQRSYTSSAALAVKLPSTAYEFEKKEAQQNLMITSAAAAAASSALTTGTNNCLKQSGVDVFNKYSNVVDSCLNEAGNQKYKINSSEIQNPSRPTSPLLNDDFAKNPNDNKLNRQYESVDNFQEKQLENFESKNETASRNYEIEIRRLNSELAQARATIDDLKSNENQLKERLESKLNDEQMDSIIPTQQIMTKQDSQDSFETVIHSKNYTSEVVLLFNNLNRQYRLKAYDSLDSVKEIKTMREFKFKLLFSVIILAYRYCKFYIKDLKRKVKNILQINEKASHASSQKSQLMAPTILVQDDENSDHPNESEVKKRKRQPEKKYGQDESSNLIIENALSKYLQVVTINKSFDLNKINEEVKEQLWNTLYDYPLKDCVELNSYINEAVKTCWSLINHQPIIKLGFSELKFDSRYHERLSEFSNMKNDQIVQFIWPSLIDSSSNACLTKGIVIT